MFDRFSRSSKKKDKELLQPTNAQGQKEQGPQEKQGPQEQPPNQEGLPTQSQVEVLADLELLAITNWRQSEASLVSAIRLQIEREKVKQEQLRLQTLDRSLTLLNMAIDYKILKSDIPLLFSNSVRVQSSEFQDKLRDYKSDSNMSTPKNARTHSASSSFGSQQPTTSVFKVSMPQQVQYQFHHWLGPGAPNEDTNKRQRRSSDFNEGPHTQAPGATPPASKSPITRSFGHKRNLSETAASRYQNIAPPVFSDQKGKPQTRTSGQRIPDPDYIKSRSKTNVNFMLSPPDKKT